MRQFGPELQIWEDLADEGPADDAVVLRAIPAVDDVAATAKGRPAAPVLFQPNRQEQRGVLGSHMRRGARKKHAWKRGDVPADVGLVEKAVLGSKLRVPEAAQSATGAGEIIGDRQTRGQLKVGG